MKKKIALITGINGQDGAYLANLLLKKNYQVHGLIRRSSTFKLQRLDYLKIRERIKFHAAELNEYRLIEQILKKLKPNLIFNLAAQSFVKYSFDNPNYTFDINFKSVLNMLDIIKQNNLDVKFYQASTSEMFGNSKKIFQNEKTKFNPESPYASSKVAAHHTIQNYRKSYNLNFYTGILFNHESFLRGREFVTKKIINGLIKIKNGKLKPIKLGNIHSKRDWGHAEDYVEAMYKIITSKKPDDYVVATGKTYSVKDFLIKACLQLDINPIFKTNKNKTQCYDKNTGILIAVTDKKYLRVNDLTYLRGDSSKIKKKLNWAPKNNLENLIQKMIKDEIKFYNPNIEYL